MDPFVASQAGALEPLRARRRRHRGRLHRPGNAALRTSVLTRARVSRIGVVGVAALATSATLRRRGGGVQANSVAADLFLVRAADDE